MSAASTVTPTDATSTGSIFRPIASRPYLAWMNSVALLSAIPATVRLPLGYPHLVALPLGAAIFGGAGYVITQDKLNGAGIVTSWSCIYLFVNGKKALLSRRPGPCALSAVIATSAIVHGVEYLSS